MRHQVDVEDMALHTFRHELAGSSGKGEHKKLIAVVTGRRVEYEVISKRVIITTTVIIEQAVTAYNDA